MIDGPRLPPANGGPAKKLVVFLHGYGADGNDLIDLGRMSAPILPDTAFASPHAPDPCDQAPMGRQWFPLALGDLDAYWRGVAHAGAALDPSSTPTRPPQARRPRPRPRRLQPGRR